MSSRDVESVLVDLATGEPTHSWRPVAGDLLAGALHQFLNESATRRSVYDSPASFEGFINGAGNVELYRATIALLSDRLAAICPVSLADVGCGDGRITRGSLPSTTRTIDLIEPSAPLLAAAATQPWPANVDVRPHSADIETFLAAHRATWDVVQATFALHNLAPDARRAVLAELAKRTTEMLVVEFDVPSFLDRSPEHAAYAVGRYRRGVAEYDGNDLVIQGFLMPVLTGQFDPSRPRVTWEQPVAHWVDDLVSAGFEAVTTEVVHDYWWAPARLIHARR